MKPVKVNSSTYIDFGAENNDKDSNFKVVNHVRISKYKNILAKGDLNGEGIVGTFNEKELQKKN